MYNNCTYQTATKTAKSNLRRKILQSSEAVKPTESFKIQGVIRPNQVYNMPNYLM